MNTNTFCSAPGRSIEADGHPPGTNPSYSGSHELPCGQGGATGDAVPTSAANGLQPANLSPSSAQTFADLEIPASFRVAVEKELTSDEKMLWVGRPSRNPEVQPRNPFLPFIGGGLLAFAVGLILVMLLARPGGGNLFGFFFAGVMGVIGLVCLIPLLVNPANTCRYCYVVTNRRALLVEFSVWQRGLVARSYLPQQLLGLERQDHATVTGAGDLIFEYELVIPGNMINPRTGSFLQQNSSGGLSNSPQRVPRGFLCLDQAREVEQLIRTTLLEQLEQALDAPKSVPTSSHGPEHPVEAISVVPLASRETAVEPLACRDDSSVPADLKEKALAGLDPNEKLVWIGQPVPRLVLLRSSGYLAVGGVGLLLALLWLVATLLPPRAVVTGSQPVRVTTTLGQKSRTISTPLPPGKLAAPASGTSLLLPVGLFFVSAGVAAVALLRWWFARRTCYALTNRRALVFKEGLLGPTRESYSPLEVSGMRRSNSWLAAGNGDLIFRTVQVVSTTRTRPGVSSSSVKTIHYGFLAIPQLDAVEKLVRATLIARFVDKLTQASAL